MRINWIDNLKGLGMILIIIGHSMFPLGSLLFGYIFSFHVALFFFMSGYLFNDKKHTNLKVFIKDKAKRLLIPYFFFNIIFYIFILITKTEHHDFFAVLKGIFYGSWLRGNEEIFLLNVSTWFLVALFLTSIFYFILNKYVKNTIVKLLILIFISIGIHYESINFSYIRLPFSIEPALMATFFYGIGHIYKEKITLLIEKINIFYIILIPLLIGLNIYFINGTNFSTNEYGNNYINFIISSFIGIITWIIIAKNIPKNSFLDFFGKNSIIILGMEFIKTRVLGVISMYGFGYIIYERSFESGIIQVIGTILIMIPIIFFINKFMPFILGNFKNK